MQLENLVASDEEDASSDSDRELQIALSSGLLKSGLNVELQPKRKSVFLKNELIESLNSLKRDLPWIEQMAIVSEPVEETELHEREMEKALSVSKSDSVHDDFKREMLFYRQAQATIKDGLSKLHKLKVPTKRPNDFFAEMAKSDDHMMKVRSHLLSKQKLMERLEKVRKIREIKKFGKKVQREALQEKKKKKDELNKKIKQFRKGQRANLNFLENDSNSDDQFQVQAEKESKQKRHFSKKKRHNDSGSKSGPSIKPSKFKSHMKKSSVKSSKPMRRGKSKRLKKK